MKKLELVGKRFGRLVVVDEVPRRIKTIRRFKCICDCGNTIETDVGNITSGRSQSCGCRQKELISNLKRSHNLKKHPLYKIWIGIKGRCLCKTNSVYKNYGKIGISICEEWINNPKAFIEWGERNGFKKDLVIDRINTYGNYEPLNCRFITRAENNNNRRDNITITYKGETKTLTEWAEVTGLKRNTIYARHRAGWKDDDMFKEKYYTLKPSYKENT